MKEPVIIIFDSGIGGLSVYEEIEKQLPHAQYHYVFDNEGFPYGNLDDLVLLKRVEKIIVPLVLEVKADVVVIACNTASTLVLPRLRQILTIPVVGVVPAIKPAAQLSKHKIGLLATPATVRRAYTHKLIEEYASLDSVVCIGSIELVEICENKIYKNSFNKDSISKIIEPFIESGVDVVVLGCTHFPLIREELQAAGRGMQFIDSGRAIANRVKQLIYQDKPNVQNEIEHFYHCNATYSKQPSLQFYATKAVLNKEMLLNRYRTVKTDINIFQLT